MKELSRLEILATLAVPQLLLGGNWDNPERVELVGVVKLFEREGGGGKFYKAFLYENIETVLERAAAEPGAQITVRFA